VPTENEADALLQVATLIPLGVLTVSNGRSAIWSGALLERGQQDVELHVHDQRRRVGVGKRAVTAGARTS